MVPEAALVSIPHNGTELVLQSLEGAGFRRVGLDGPVIPDKSCIRFGHLYNPRKQVRAFQLAAHIPVVVPMRHPYRWEQSCKNRSVSEGVMATYYEAWEFLLDMLLHRKRVIPIPVDAAPSFRHGQLERVSQAVGAKITVPWDQLVNGWSGGVSCWQVPMDEFEPSPEAERLERHPLIQVIYSGRLS